jgi:plastocyanin
LYFANQGNGIAAGVSQMNVQIPRMHFFVFALVLFTPPISLWAQTTHDVTVGDNFFSPSSLTIEVGDTVRWTNAAGGAPHDVTADDFSWASATQSQFIFSRQFNSVEEVLYHCTVHASPGGNSMNGSISVVDGGGAFNINAGLNDSWFNPATAGQGFFITVFPDITSVFLAWFTYDTVRPPAEVTANLGEPGHRWLTAFGNYSGDTATLDVELTEGGVFDSAVPAVTQSADGSITVEFSDCENGMITYDITSANVQGVIPIQRIALDNVGACEELAAQ